VHEEIRSAVMRVRCINGGMLEEVIDVLLF
jgi:hypothetical protein